MKKLSAIIAFVFITLAMLGYLYYGWLLFQTLTSDIGPAITIESVFRFALWLLPLVGLVVFAILWGIEAKSKCR